MNKWQTYRLSDIADVQTGPFGSQLHQRDYVDVGTPCIMPCNIGANLDVQTDNIAHLKASDIIRLNKYCVKEGDIIYSRRGDIEKCAYINHLQEGWLCGTGCLRIRPNTSICFPKYLAYLLSTKESKKWIVANAVGTTMLNLNSSILNTMPIFLPPLAEQKRIADILSAIDDKIELNRRINANLEQQAQALYKSWFVDADSTGWETKRLADFFNVITGKKDANYSTKDGVYPFFTCSQDILKAPNYSFEGAAILLAGNGDFNVKRYIGKFEAYQRTYVLIPFEKRYHSFLYLLIKYHLQEITGGSRGSVIKFITKGNIADFTFTMPPYSIDEKLSLFDSLFNEIDKNITEINNLSTIRDTLLPKLMSGEIKA